LWIQQRSLPPCLCLVEDSYALRAALAEPTCTCTHTHTHKHTHKPMQPVHDSAPAFLPFRHADCILYTHDHRRTHACKHTNADTHMHMHTQPQTKAHINIHRQLRRCAWRQSSAWGSCNKQQQRRHASKQIWQHKCRHCSRCVSMCACLHVCACACVYMSMFASECLCP
jgi:hypothetical protein